MYEFVQDLIDPSLWNLKCPYEMTPSRIVVHNTDNDASAANEISYMKTNSNSTSFHYAIDDKEVRQGLPINRNSWNAGDGTNGPGNRNGVSIEICYSKSGGERFALAEDNAARFIAEFLRERGWDISAVTKHRDYNGKNCPARTLSIGWERFLSKIENYLEINNETENAEMIYNYIDENMPAWARPTIQKLVDKGYLNGNENGELLLSDTMLRIFVVNDRAGLYD